MAWSEGSYSGLRPVFNCVITEEGGRIQWLDAVMGLRWTMRRVPRWKEPREEQGCPLARYLVRLGPHQDCSHSESCLSGPRSGRPNLYSHLNGSATRYRCSWP